MNKIKNNDLVKIIGGASITSSLINSFVRLVDSLLDVGRRLGSSLRRISTNNLCPMK